MVTGTLDLALLRLFEAVLDARSVSAAGERLGLSQPRVSAGLARLRRIFDDELFIRAAGAMQPTPKAWRLAPGIRAALDALRQTLADELSFAPAEAAQTFVIASTDYTTMVVLPKLLAALRDDAPGIDLRIIGYDKRDVSDLIDRGEIDVALGVFPDAPDRLVRQMLCDERFVGLARQGHPLIVDGRIELQAYVAAAHALVSTRRDQRGAIDEALARRRLSRRIAITLPHMLALPHLLRSSDLLTAIPGRVAASIVETDLQTFALPIMVPAWKVQMLWNPAARSDQASAWLRSNIVAAAGNATPRLLSPPA